MNKKKWTLNYKRHETAFKVKKKRRELKAISNSPSEKSNMIFTHQNGFFSNVSKETIPEGINHSILRYIPESERSEQLFNEIKNQAKKLQI